MQRTAIGIACGILITLALITTLLACTTTSEPKYAGPITEEILTALNDGDYYQYCTHFDSAMKEVVTEDAFKQTYEIVIGEVGNYVSKEFWNVERHDKYTMVLYKAKFTKEPADVIVRVVFDDTSGEPYVSGLWFDSPKLRE